MGIYWLNELKFEFLYGLFGAASNDVKCRFIMMHWCINVRRYTRNE